MGERNDTDGQPAAACLFMSEEMTVETRDDIDNRRLQGRVVEEYDVVLTSTAAGFLLTDIYD